jgi:hypothetical protein
MSKKSPSGPKIVFQGMSPSQATAEVIRQRALVLGASFPRLLRVWVRIGRSSKRHRKGNPFEVTLKLFHPGCEIVAISQSAPHGSLDAAIGDAFRTSKRQLEDELETRFRVPRRRIRVSAVRN